MPRKKKNVRKCYIAQHKVRLISPTTDKKLRNSNLNTLNNKRTNY